MLTAKPSPRFEDETLYWYAGNTFEIKFEFNLTCGDREISISPQGRLIFRFKKDAANVGILHEMEFENIQDNTVVLVMDEETSAKFPKGNYLFSVTYYDEYTTTLVDSYSIKVEGVV